MLGSPKLELKCLYLVLCFSYLLVTSLKPEKSLLLECFGSIKHDIIENFKVKEGFFDQEFTSLKMYQISQGDSSRHYWYNLR